MLIDFVRRHSSVCVCSTQIQNHFFFIFTKSCKITRRRRLEIAPFFILKCLFKVYTLFLQLCAVCLFTCVFCYISSSFKSFSTIFTFKSWSVVTRWTTSKYYTRSRGREALCVWTLQSKDHLIILPASSGALAHTYPRYRQNRNLLWLWDR